jgi:hypothetical protein
VVAAQPEWQRSWASGHRFCIGGPNSFGWATQQGGQPELTPERRAELEERIRDLTEENAKLLEQREVLKKSLGILSEMPPRGMPKSSK